MNGSNEIDDPDVDRLTGAILDGRPIDWATESFPRDESLLEELKIVAAIAEVHRTPGPEGGGAGLAQWGHLTIIEKIGQGTSGEVFLAIDNRLQRDVALKLLFPTSGPRTSPDVAVDEACLLAKIRHPNVVTVFGAEQINDRTGIITEHVAGQTLADLVRQQGPFGPQEAVTIGIDLCRALGAVHHAGLVHRDVKAHNVMREKGGRIILMDLGAGNRVLEPVARLAGTPLYVAPEVLKGQPSTPQSDIYSLGVLLFHLVTGRYPVSGATIDDIREAHGVGRRTLLPDIRPSLPHAFTSVVARAIEPDPAARFHSAGEMEAALLRALEEPGGRPRLSRPAGLPRRLLLAGAATIMLTAALIGMAWRSTPATPRVPFEAREWVLVVPFENRSGNANLDGALEHAFEHALSTSAYVNIVPPERVDDALQLMTLPVSTPIDARIGREVALRDGNVRVILTGSIARVGDSYPITVAVIDPVTGGTLASEREEPASESAIPEAIRSLSAWIRLTLGETSHQVAQSTRALEKATTASLPALRDYSDAMTAVRSGKWGRAEALLTSAVAKDEDFASAQIWLAWAQRNLSRPDGGLATAARAAGLADRTTDRERHFIVGSNFLLNNQHDRAEAEFEALVGRYPDDYWGQKKLFDIYLQTRSREEIRLLAVRAASARPNDPASRIRAATEEMRIELSAARPHFARAKELLDARAATALPPQWRLYVWFFPAHDFWTQRRVDDVERTLVELERQVAIGQADPFLRSRLVTFRLTLGQPRAAEQLARTESAGLKALLLGFVALAREDMEGISRALSGYSYFDVAASSILIRAGRITAAENLLSSLGTTDPQRLAWSKAEIQVARGSHGDARKTLQDGIRFLRFAGSRSFLYTETLAETLVKSGDRAGAIASLEAQVAGGNGAYSPTAHLGFLWMRCAKRLADVYRSEGRINDAIRIEKDLLDALSRAEPDFPLVVEMQKRARLQ